MFDSVTQFQYKLHFRNALIITFRTVHNLSGFEEVQIFPLFLVMTSLLRHRSYFENLFLYSGSH